MDWTPQRFSLSFTAWREYLLPAADGDLIRYSDAVAEVERLRGALKNAAAALGGAADTVRFWGAHADDTVDCDKSLLPDDVAAIERAESAARAALAEKGDTDAN